MTGPGRPEIGPVVKVRLPDDVIAHLDRWAKDEEVTRAEAIRHMVMSYLAR